MSEGEKKVRRERTAQGLNKEFTEVEKGARFFGEKKGAPILAV